MKIAKEREIEKKKNSKRIRKMKKGKKEENVENRSAAIPSNFDSNHLHGYSFLFLSSFACFALSHLCQFLTGHLGARKWLFLPDGCDQ